MKLPRAAAIDRVRSALLVVLWILAVAGAVGEGYAPVRVWMSMPDMEQQARIVSVGDVDQAVFLKDIHAHFGIMGPLFWWNHGWHGTAYPYYWRPLTMLGFWTECHLFGTYRYDRWQAANCIFHLAFAFVLAAFAVRMTGSRFAGPLSFLLFAGNPTWLDPILWFPKSFTTPPALVVLQNWKDQPEAWTAICSLGACMLAMDRRWWGALALAAASVCFKESGWITYPMLMATLLYTGDLRKPPRAVWAALILSWIVLIAFRASAGHNVMFPPREANNSHGVDRYLINVVDPRVAQLSSSTWPVVPLALVFAWLILQSRLRAIPRFLTALAAVGIAAVLLAFTQSTDPVTGLAILVDPRAAGTILLETVVDFSIIAIAWRRPAARKAAVYLYALVLLSALPEIAVKQPNMHMLYFTDGLQSALVVTVGIACLRQLAAMLPRRAPAGEAADRRIPA